jgi:hypothetical protein
MERNNSCQVPGNKGVLCHAFMWMMLEAQFEIEEDLSYIIIVLFY